MRAIGRATVWLVKFAVWPIYVFFRVAVGIAIWCAVWPLCIMFGVSLGSIAGVFRLGRPVPRPRRTPYT